MLHQPVMPISRGFGSNKFGKKKRKTEKCIKFDTRIVFIMSNVANRMGIVPTYDLTYEK